MPLSRVRQARDVILTRAAEEHRARVAVVELQTKYLVGAVWAAGGNARKGQPTKAADAVRFLPKPRVTRLPSTAQVMTMFAPG